MTIQQFRLLIWACVIFAVGALVASIALESTLPQPLQDYLTAYYEQDFSMLEIMLLVLFVPATVWCLFSMYRLRPYARTFAVSLTILSLAIYPLGGPVVESAWAEVLMSCSEMLWGALILAMYLPPLCEHFRKGAEAVAT